MPRVEKWVPVAQRMLEGKIIPFLGAGASCFDIRPHGNLDPANAPPTGQKLLEMVAAEAELEIGLQCSHCRQSLHNLAQVASYYARVAHSRPQLDSRLAQLTGKPAFHPNALHRLIARVALQKPLLAITTNYDTLLEHAFDQAGVSYEVVATAADVLAYNDAEDDYGEARAASASVQAGMIYHRLGEVAEFEPVPPATIRPELKDRSLVYKVHGTVTAGNGWSGGYLIAEEDYVRFLGRMDQEHIFPFGIKNRLRAKTTLPTGRKAPLYSLLFLGYSLSDWNLRVLLDELGLGRGAPGDERHYAILHEFDAMSASLLEKRNIRVHKTDLNLMVGELEATLEDLGLK